MKFINKIKAYLAPKPLFNNGQRLRARKGLKANLKANYSEYLPVGVVYYKVDEEIDILPDMVLIFVKESGTKIYFRVRSNFYSSDVNARDNSIIYFYKSNFKTKNFIKI